MKGTDRRHLGKVFNEVAELYDRSAQRTRGSCSRSCSLAPASAPGRPCSRSAPAPGRPPGCSLRSQDPPLEDEVRTTDSGWGPIESPTDGLFGPPTVTWCPTVQWFDGAGFADLLRSLSIYRDLPPDLREPLLAAVADRITTRMSDRAPRRYLTVLRVAPRID